jgi:glycosyltransferase involved in cell wall biosynthesis
MVADLDCLLFAERPDPLQLVEIASREGVAIACIPNWEHLAPDLDWIPFVDLMICPTRATYALLSDWRARYRLAYDIELVPWPVDLTRHTFRRRKRCRSVLFVNGWGGCRARRLDGSVTHYSRKGLDTVIAAAALAPEIQFIATSQAGIGGALPGNLRILGRAVDNRSLYDVGDVCLQPSHWEGIGLPLLECQAAGMPLLTTDAPPMNEYRPLATLPVSGKEIVCLSSQPFLSSLVDPADVVVVLRQIHGTSIAEASTRARQFIETEHSWSSRAPEIHSALRRCVGNKRASQRRREMRGQQ